MKKIRRLVVAYPGGNATAIVFDELAGSNRESLNSAIMKSWKALFPNEPAIEQCCLLLPAGAVKAAGRVEMFGGEFCGNALRAAAWLLQGSGSIAFTPAGNTLKYRIEKDTVALQMPLPIEVRQVSEGMLITFDGITQLVVITEGKRNNKPRTILKRLLAEKKYGLARQAAAGVSCYDPESGKAEFTVWVRAVATMFDETACGSGSCAIAVERAIRTRRDAALDIRQPSGQVIRAVANRRKTGGIRQTSIAGTVKILYDGPFTLDKP